MYSLISSLNNFLPISVRPDRFALDINTLLSKMCVPGSSVGIAIDYGLDGPGSNPGGDEIFRRSTSALGPTQPPVKWVPALSRR
jgi:hypothetical protein